MFRWLLGAAVLYAVLRTAKAEGFAGELDHGLSVPQYGPDIFGFLESLGDLVMPYKIPATATPYLPMLRAAETANGIPTGLLVRIAYQESRFRPEIINGKVKSSAGAVGIMQIVPRWHPGINAADPSQAIPYAAQFLRRMYQMFGSWPVALMAYNWGPGNVKKYLAGQTSPPLETRNYVAQITRDVQVA